MTLLAAPTTPSLADPRGRPALAVGRCADRARSAQRDWGRRSVQRRLAVIADARRLMVDRAEVLAATVTHDDRRSPAETLASEVMPLVEAARYLERRAGRLLKPRRPRAGRPIIGLDLAIEIDRPPWGVVLIVGPGNYPLMLPGVQALQALAAGNAVLLKPGRGGSLAAERLAEVLADAGLPPELFQVLDESNESGLAAVEAGVDHVVLTGSEAAGRAVADAAARSLTPTTMELGGHDAAIVLDDADLDLTVRALVFGLTSNRGATCIAPRRLFAAAATAAAIEKRLVAALTDLPPGDRATLRPEIAARLDQAVADATERGARLVAAPSNDADNADAANVTNVTNDAESTPDAHAPDRPPAPAPSPATVLADVPPEARVMHEDLFAPMLAICPVASVDEAVVHVNACDLGLGASVFGPAAPARAVADQLDVGVAAVNDLIAPVGDPRLPLAGRGLSGFGVTRGDEGLLAMTRPRALALRRGSRRPHYQRPDPASAALIGGYLRFAHGRSLRQRLGGLRELIRSLRGRT